MVNLHILQFGGNLGLCGELLQFLKRSLGFVALGRGMLHIELDDDVAFLDHLAFQDGFALAILKHRNDLAFNGSGDAGDLIGQRLRGADRFGPFFHKKLPGLHPFDGCRGRSVNGLWELAPAKRLPGPNQTPNQKNAANDGQDKAQFASYSLHESVSRSSLRGGKFSTCLVYSRQVENLPPRNRYFTFEPCRFPRGSPLQGWESLYLTDLRKASKLSRPTQPRPEQMPLQTTQTLQSNQKTTVIAHKSNHLTPKMVF